jgi:hypothetical protein
VGCHTRGFPSDAPMTGHLIDFMAFLVIGAAGSFCIACLI